jgi:KaiC/GvpD/RAD55 family RecA-like ATPase
MPGNSPPSKNENDEALPLSSMSPPQKLSGGGVQPPQKPAEPAVPTMEIGTTFDGKPMSVPLEIMKKHYVCFGASGSGKTVLGKVFLEECARNGIPCIIVDPQGDLASLGLIGDQTELIAHKSDLVRAKEYEDKIEVRIFTPISSKGIPIRVEVFNMPDKDVPVEERVNAIDMTASSIVGLLDYDTESPKGTAARKYIYMILEAADRKGITLDNLTDLIEYVKDPTPVGVSPTGVIKKSDQDSLSIDMGHLTIGVDDLLFSNGVAMTMDTFLTPVQEGKTPVNIIYLNTLNTDRHKHFFLSCLTKELYNWMLKNPSSDVQLAFYVDEVGPFMPPDPYQPPAKQLLKMLYKQGRKYGVAMMMCTQNIADIEYKALAQASTWAIGKLMTQQDLGKINQLLKSLPKEEYDRILAQIPKLKTCNFVFINSDVFKQSITFQSRWLYSQHKTLDEDSLKGAMKPEVVDYFKDPLEEAPGEPVTPFTPTEDEPDEGTETTEPRPQDAQADGPSTDDMKPLTTEEKYAPEHLIEMPVKGAKPGAIVTTQAPIAPPTTEQALAPAPTVAEAAQDRFIYVADVKVPQAEASKTINSWSKRLLYSGEEVVQVETEYVILWRVKVTVEVPDGMISFLAKKIARDEYLYVVASKGLPFSGQLMQVGDQVVFSNVTTKKAHEIKDLDNNTEFAVLDYRQLPFNIDVVPQMTLAEVERIIYNLYGLEVQRARRCIYKLWRFTVSEKKTGKQRYVRIDSVFGKPVQML